MPVGERLDQRRAGAGASALGRGRHGVVHDADVVSVDARLGHRVGVGPVGDAVDRRGEVLRGVLAVEVVLAQEDHRERPDRRHVQRLVKRPDVRRAVAEEAQRHPAVAQVLRRERRPEGDRQMRAHDRERPVCADGDVREVHRAALAAAQAVRLAHDLSEGPVGRRPHREHGAVAAVGAEHRVAVPKRAARPHDDGLLPLAQMRRAAHEPRREEALGGLLERADLPHAPEERARLVVGQRVG